MIKGWYSRPTTPRAKRRLFWKHPFYKNFRPECYDPVVNPWFTSPTAWFLSTETSSEFREATEALGFMKINVAERFEKVETSYWPNTRITTNVMSTQDSWNKQTLQL